MGIGLAKFSQTWDILLIYYNNYVKMCVTTLLTLARGAFSVPFLLSMSEAFFVPFLTLIKLCYAKALEWSNLVPIPKAKSSSGIMKLTLLAVSSRLPPPWNLSTLLPRSPGFATSRLPFSISFAGFPWLFGLQACAVSGPRPYPLSHSSGPHQIHMHYKLFIC